MGCGTFGLCGRGFVEAIEDGAFDEGVAEVSGGEDEGKRDEGDDEDVGVEGREDAGDEF